MCAIALYWRIKNACAYFDDVGLSGRFGWLDESNSVDSIQTKFS
jgi:hypothetical protein